jgi:AcrR family transcriptional regulator
VTELAAREPPPESTSAAIKAAALELFASVGYQAASMRQIARAVGIQPASLYNHYPSKEALLWDICREAMDELLANADAAIGRDDEPEQQLRRFVRQHTRFHIERRRAALVINRQLASLSPAHYAEITEMRDAYERKLRGLLRRGANEGLFHIPDARLASYAVLAIGLHVSVWYRDDGRLSAERIIDHHERLAVQLVGLRPGR